MADQKLSDRSTLSATAVDDYIHIVDKSDTTDSAQGTSKSIEKRKYLNSVSILDFVGDDTEKDKITSNNETQTVATVTTAFNDAITYCKTNGIKSLKIPSGTYLINAVTIDALNDFRLIGEGAVIKYQSGLHTLKFTNCVNWSISGIEFSSNESSYSDVTFLHISTNSGFINVTDCTFTDMVRCGIRAESLAGGTYTKGIFVSNCKFIDSSNYSNDNQCGIELGSDGEYSQVTNNVFQEIPSAIRIIGGANSIFSYNTVMNLNGGAYDVNKDTACIYSESNGNSGKVDIVYNKINHNVTGAIAIVLKGDATKPQNAFKVIGNDILVHGTGSNALGIYLEDAPYSIIENNKIRGWAASPNDDGIYIVDSNKVIIKSNYIKDYDNGINIATSSGCNLETNIFDTVTTNINFDSGSSDFLLNNGNKGNVSLDDAYTISNDDHNKTLYNYTSSNYAVTIPTNGLKSDIKFNLDAVSSDITVAEGSNTFLPSGNKTISAGDYAEVFRDGSANNFRFRVFSSVGGTVSPPSSSNYQAIIDKANLEGFTLPSSATQTALNTFVIALETSGVWAAADFIMLMAYNDTNVQDFTRINLKNPTDTLAAYTGGTYTVNGFKGDGSTAYIDTNFNPSTDGVNFVQDSASRIGVVYQAASNAATTVNRLDGQATALTNLMFQQSGTQNRINSTNTTSTFDMSGTGLKAFCRTSSSNIVAHNKGVNSSLSSTSTGVDSQNMYILRDRTNYGDCGISLYILGGNMNSMISSLRTDFDTYLTTIGLSAIS